MIGCWLRIHSAARFACVFALSAGFGILGAAPGSAQSGPAHNTASTPPVAPVTGEVGTRGVIILRAEPKRPETAAPMAIAPPSPIAVPEPAPTPTPVLEPALAPIAPPARPPVAQTAPAGVVQLGSQPCPRPFVRPDLILAASAQQSGNSARDFNRALRRKLLARRGPVIVDLAQPYAADKLPATTLAAWLGRIKSSGGAVRTMSYCEQPRGLFGMFRRAFSSDSPADYAAAEAYDAVQHVNGRDQTVTQIEFRPREPSK